MTMGKKPFRNVGFSPFPANVFYPIKELFKLSSAQALNLDQSIILLFGKDLITGSIMNGADGEYYKKWLMLQKTKNTKGKKKYMRVMLCKKGT